VKYAEKRTSDKMVNAKKIYIKTVRAKAVVLAIKSCTQQIRCSACSHQFAFFLTFSIGPRLSFLHSRDTMFVPSLLCAICLFYHGLGIKHKNRKNIKIREK